MLRFAAAGAAAIAMILASCSQDVKITSPRYALVIGVQNYIHVSSLQYTLNDATSMSQLLITQGWNTTQAPDATRADIVAEIAYLSSHVELDSTVLLYYSGHGDLTNDRTTGIIAPADTDFQYSGPSIVYINGIAQIDETTVISAPQLGLMLAALPTKNVIVILDSCYSGGFVTTGSTVDASPPDYSQMPSYSAFATAMSNFGSLLSANASASGQKAPIVISAAGSQELSIETFDLQHGVFTYYFLQSAAKGDSDGNGFVTTTEAFTYSMNGVKAWDSYNFAPAFLPHLSGGVRDLVLFGQ